MINCFKYSFLTLTFILLVTCIFGQTKEDLRQKKISAQKDIKYTNELLKVATKNKKNSYNKYLLLNKQISTRKSLILSIEQEIDYLSIQLEIHQEVILSLESDLDNLKREYARVIYNSYKNKNNYHKIMFVLASDDFNTAFKRIKYFQQYTIYRRLQAEKITNTRIEISDQIIELDILSAEKQDLLIDNKIENEQLVNAQYQQKLNVQQLTTKEKDLKKKLQKQYKIAQRLQREIERIIEEEARLAALKSKNSDPKYFSLTPEEKLVAANFVSNKGHLPWPTERGIITSNFGEHPHPVMKGLKVRNDGVDIRTSEGSVVRAVFKGVVSSVIYIPGAHKTVIIRHGNYISVYTNLKSVIVKKGDSVSTKQTIGVVFTDHKDNNSTVLQFQVWKEMVKLNPEFWLAKSSNG